ncbi:helix-turn-helix domain-containing protein, partial [Achromobacter sp. GG226]|uniref:helix-turn-helix domain-containing protein n=1 Tax=Verticiella alkaliphila TaxID=2779529 RepID=UPI001C0DE359
MTQSMSGVDSIAHSGTPPAGASFGASLRALREARGWSVGDVSARLKFLPRQIEAIEADRWEDLPQGPSLRGLVRNYARLLDQDPEVMMRAIPAHLQHQPQSNPHLRNTVATDISASAPLERWGGTAPPPARLVRGHSLAHRHLRRGPGGLSRRRVVVAAHGQWRWQRPGDPDAVRHPGALVRARGDGPDRHAARCHDAGTRTRPGTGRTPPRPR